MSGFITNLMSNIGPLLLIGIFCFVIVKLYALAVPGLWKSIKGKEMTTEDREYLKRVVKSLYIVVTLIIITSIFVFGFFFSNPLSEPGKPTIHIATPDETYVEQTREEIKKTNKEVITEKAKEKREEATEDNNKAMEEARKLFQ